MSFVYVLESPTKGKVVLNTTHGPLDVELWPKEAPKAARNFVQLCLEGYYNNTIFHRVIKAFLIQGGDPTDTGTGGESIYGGVFADEFHSRLRFNHRGLVACANAGSPHSNGSQFFISLDRCDWLDRKNTIFGKVTGALTACSHAGLVDEGLQYYDEMKASGIAPRIEHYGCLVDLLSRAGRLKEALDVIEGMPMKPNEVVVGSLVAACRLHGNLGLAERLMHYLVELEPETDSNYVLLSNIYTASVRCMDAEKTWQKFSK